MIERGSWDGGRGSGSGKRGGGGGGGMGGLRDVNNCLWYVLIV